MKNKEPLVSICIPTYNGARFIEEAIESAINQIYPNLEIIISDDDSKDETLNIIKSYKDKTKIPIYIYKHKPSGIGANWNNCIHKAKGKYIKFLFQDDLLDTTCINKMVDVIENDKTIELVLSKRNILVDEVYKSDITNKWIETYGDLQNDLNLTFNNGVAIIDKKILKLEEFLNVPLNNFGEPSVILFRKELIDQVGGFREDLVQILDFEFCNRVLLKNKIAILDEKLVSFRLHLEQTTNKNSNNNSDLEKYDKIVYKEYFWFLNNKVKINLFLKNNPKLSNYYSAIKRRLKYYKSIIK